MMNFHYPALLKQCMVFYVLVSLWVYELLCAVSQFAIAYAVQLWYFSETGPSGRRDAPGGRLLKGYRLGLTYHLGTMAHGSLLIAPCRGLRSLLAFVAREAEGDGN